LSIFHDIISGIDGEFKAMSGAEEPAVRSSEMHRVERTPLSAAFDLDFGWRLRFSAA
jgi:hypothetical protein